MASSVNKEDIKKLREARYLSKDIAHRLPAKGKSSLPRNPKKGWCFSPTSSAGWDSPSTCSSVD